MLKTTNYHQQNFVNGDKNNPTNVIELDEQLVTQLKKLQSEYDSLVVEFGNITFRKLILEEEEKQLTQLYNSTRNLEINYLNKLMINMVLVLLI